MKLLARIVVIVVVFVLVAELAGQIATHITGTPPNNLNAIMDKATTAKELVATLSSAPGRELLTAYSKWIIFIYLPAASLAAAVVARVLNVSNKLTMGIVAILYGIRVGLMAAASRIVWDEVASLFGTPPFSDVGVSPLEIIFAFFLCECLAGAVLYIGRVATVRSG